MYTLKEDDIIYNDKLKIIKFVVEGEQAKVYLGYIKAINSHVIVKRYLLNTYDYNIAEKLPSITESLRQMKYPRICKYYDINYVKQFKVSKSYSISQ